MKFLKIICRHWYNFGLAAAVIAGAALVIFWKDMSILLRLNTVSFIAILLHQFEEYGFPGGEPMIMNRALQGSDIPDRYPLNQFSAMFTNVFFSYVIYLLPVIFPNIIWLGIAPMLMGMMQFIIHGIMTNIKMKSIYNPGLGAVVFLHIPAGVYYIYYITVNRLASGTIWAVGIIYTIAATVFVLGFLTYVVFSDRNSKWVFDETELKRFHVEEKLAKKNISADGRSQPDPLAVIEKIWNVNNISNQTGKTIIVTGGTSGIGYEAALALAKADAEVIIASRNENKGNMTLRKIRQIYPSANVSFMCLDTSSQESVKEFCNKWLESGKKIDTLILNAGISNVPKREETVDGFERQLATNYLGHFTMTALLLPRMNSGGRIIPVSSLAHKRTHLNFDDLQFKRHYNPMTVYNHSKLAVLTFALELSRRLQEQGSDLKVIPVHPGVAATEITRGGDRANPVIQKFAKRMFGLIGQSAEQGAWPILYAATCDDVQNGAYYGPGGAGERKGTPALANIAHHAADRENAEKLWKMSEELTCSVVPF